jgi:cytochrome c oxidase subunit I
MSVETHEGVHRHPAPTGFIRKYIFSIDHKVIGIQYILLALAAVLVGMAMSLLMRLNLSWPGTSWPILETLFPTGAPGGVMNPEFYLSLVTMHGTIMVFFVLTTAPQGGFGNYFLPIQIGAEDMAFPVLNMLSFWVTFVGFIVILMAIFVEGNQGLGEMFAGLGPSFAGGSGTVGPIGGWTGYAPLSALGKIAGPGQGAGMNLWVISIAIFCVGSLLGALNFITTLLNMRTKGMSLMRMPLTCWAWFTTAVLALLSFPVLLGGGILLLLDRIAGTSFFIPGGLYVSGLLSGSNPNFPLHTGGSPILWQHLFWFFGHPEVYIAILPGAWARRLIFSRPSRESPCLVIARWCLRSSRSVYSVSSFGATTCS